MSIWHILRIIAGLFVSTFGGWFICWIFINKGAWPYANKWHALPIEEHNLTNPLGIIERLLYAVALSIGIPEWIAVWLGIKTAVGWARWSKEETRVAYNIFLIGNAISVIFGFIGAWIIMGKFPMFH